MKKSIHDLAVQAEKKLRNQRAQVVQSHPFFGALLLKQKLVPTTDVQTLATNGKELFFNPEYVLNQRVEYLQFDCAHEALHPGLGHHTRRGGRRFDWWNEACDLAINPVLKQAGFHCPPDALFRDDLIGQSAEAIFKVLEGERRPDPDGDDQDDSPGAGEDTSEPPPTPQPLPPEDSEGDGESDDQGDAGDADDSGDGDGSKGDGPDGEPADGDSGGGGESGEGQQVPSFGGTGAVLDAPVESEAERVAEENDWKVAATQAANLAAAQDAGDLPGALQAQLDALIKPKANWRELLRRYMDQFAKSDYTWAKGNRRFIGQGTYLPSLQSEQLPPVLFVIDTSGSMPADALEQAAGELQSILDELQPEYIDVICHDTQVCGDVQRFEPGEDLDIEIRGGGGTRFAPTCDWIADSDEDYAVVIWFTDLYVNDWDMCDEPDVPVIFIDYANRPDGEEAAQFGDEVIGLEDDWS
jgi:predicted metal-dependent peptidase